MVDRAELLAEAQRRGLVPSQQPSKDDLMAEAQRRGLIQPQQSPESIFRGSAQAEIQTNPYDERMAQKWKQYRGTADTNRENLNKMIEGNAEFKDAGSFESWQWRTS